MKPKYFLFIGGLRGPVYQKATGESEVTQVLFLQDEEFKESYNLIDNVYVREDFPRGRIEEEIKRAKEGLPICAKCKTKIDGMRARRLPKHKAVQYVMYCHDEKESITLTNKDVQEGRIPSFEYAFDKKVKIHK